MSKNLLLFFLLALVLGCGGTKQQTSPEVQARIDYAKKLDGSNVIRHVSYHTSGDKSDVLDIDVTDDVAPYAAPDTIELLVTPDLKKDAKRLGFVQIHIKGGSRTFTEPDTIDRTFNL